MIKENKACSLPQGKTTPIKHQLIELFWTLGPAFTRWAESHMREQGLTPQRMRLLSLLRENGSMKMGALGDELGVTATNITALVDALEKDDMVTRKSHPTDRRTTLIELTARAENQLKENCTKFKDSVSEIFSAFTTTEQERFLTFLQHTREALVERNILEKSDLCSQPNKSKHK